MEANLKYYLNTLASALHLTAADISSLSGDVRSLARSTLDLYRALMEEGAGQYSSEAERLRLLEIVAYRRLMCLFIGHPTPSRGTRLLAKARSVVEREVRQVGGVLIGEDVDFESEDDRHRMRVFKRKR